MKKMTIKPLTKALAALFMLALLLCLIPALKAAGAGGTVAVVVATQPDGTPYKDVVDAALAVTGIPDGYDKLEDALLAASSGQTVVLLEDYTMSASATVKTGVMLLLPCEDTYKAFEDNGYNPDGTGTTPARGPGAGSAMYSHLSIPSSAKLTVNGSMLVNAVTGKPTAICEHEINGGYGQVDNDGVITVNAGATLEVCGYVRGSGTVEANSGSTVNDLYVVRGWRGGTIAQYAYGNPQVYPFNRATCYNIQCRLDIYSGASYQGIVKMYAQNPVSGISSFNYTRFRLIGNGSGTNSSMICLEPGAVASRTYYPDPDPDKVRVEWEITGGAQFLGSSLRIYITETFFMNLTTNAFIYPYDGNQTFILNDGTYVMTESFKFLPGFEMYVGSNAELVVNAGKTIVYYDEFNDINVVSGTAYPNRPPAFLSLGDGAKLTVNGAFAGNIMSTASETPRSCWGSESS